MFMGSSERVLGLIKIKSAEIYPNLEVVTYSPPYKPEFSKEDNAAIVTAINSENPDLLWIGMTAPKQEKWTYTHWDELDIHCHVGTIGAVFDFFDVHFQGYHWPAFNVADSFICIGAAMVIVHSLFVKAKVEEK
jgi:exopolysaccharide biosynthesis WecB/TagA/CpsF family protein